MKLDRTNEQDVTTAAIMALGWVLADDARAQRFLALTGFSPDDLVYGWLIRVFTMRSDFF